MMRLQKYLARSGVASRRTSEKFITSGRIKVNDMVVTELGTSVDEFRDVVKFDDEIVHIVKEKICIILNKSAGFVTSMNDEKGRRDVSLLVDPDKYKSVFPVGRLDMNTRGLLLFTNDGELGNALMHPKHEVKKTYIARVKGTLSAGDIEKLRLGVDIGDYVTQPCTCRCLKGITDDVDPGREVILRNEKVAGFGFSDYEIAIHEGKNRQVRRMFKSLGFEVVDLVRTNYAQLSLAGLTSGSLRILNEKEMLALRNNCIV